MAPERLGNAMSAGCGIEKLERGLAACCFFAGAELSLAKPPTEATPHHVTHTTGAISAAIRR